jgi:hypothetical protein
VSKVLWSLGGYALFVIAVFFAIGTYLDLQIADERARERISILQARVAEAETQRVVDSVEVVRTVTKTRTLRDSVLLRLTDTVAVERYIYQTDTLRTACLACVASAARLKVSYDSLSRFQDSLIQARRPSWKQRFGISCGYSAVKIGSDLKAGPSCGIGVRVWP